MTKYPVIGELRFLNNPWEDLVNLYMPSFMQTLYAQNIEPYPELRKCTHFSLYGAIDQTYRIRLHFDNTRRILDEIILISDSSRIYFRMPGNFEHFKKYCSDMYYKSLYSQQSEHAGGLLGLSTS